jgi:hypothetical protein
MIMNSWRDLNTVMVHARIQYKDPITNELRIIDGIGGKAIQQDANSKIDEFNSTMKRNGLEIGYPMAYSRAIKNAAKKLGKLFGSDLNRDDEMNAVHVFNPGALKTADDRLLELSELFDEVGHLIQNEEDRMSIEMIIDKKLVASYPKAIRELKALKK